MVTQEDPQTPSQEQAITPSTPPTAIAAAASSQPPPPPPPSLTPDQALQREKKINSLTTKITHLNSQISTLTAELSTTKEKLAPFIQNKTPPLTPQSIVQRHIRLLHEYNEVKDIAQGLMGMIADARGVRHIVVQREFGVAKDE